SHLRIACAGDPPQGRVAPTFGATLSVAFGATFAAGKRTSSFSPGSQGQVRVTGGWESLLLVLVLVLVLVLEIGRIGWIGRIENFEHEHEHEREVVEAPERFQWLARPASRSTI